MLLFGYGKAMLQLRCTLLHHDNVALGEYTTDHSGLLQIGGGPLPYSACKYFDAYLANALYTVAGAFTQALNYPERKEYDTLGYFAYSFAATLQTCASASAPSLEAFLKADTAGCPLTLLGFILILLLPLLFTFLLFLSLGSFCFRNLLDLGFQKLGDTAILSFPSRIRKFVNFLIT